MISPLSLGAIRRARHEPLATQKTGAQMLRSAEFLDTNQRLSKRVRIDMLQRFTKTNFANVG